MVTPHLPWKFHANRSSRFFVMLLTKKQRNKQRNKERNKSRENNIVIRRLPTGGEVINLTFFILFDWPSLLYYYAVAHCFTLSRIYRRAQVRVVDILGVWAGHRRNRIRFLGASHVQWRRRMSYSEEPWGQTSCYLLPRVRRTLYRRHHEPFAHLTLINLSQLAYSHPHPAAWITTDNVCRGDWIS